MKNVSGNFRESIEIRMSIKQRLLTPSYASATIRKIRKAASGKRFLVV